MNKLRTFYGIKDDLQDFAEDFLNRPSYLSAAGSLVGADGALTSVVVCEGRFQVELCVTYGGLVIPEHIHPNADTIEVSVAGALRLRVNGEDPFGSVPDELVARRNRWRGIRINHNDWHGTTVGNPGAIFFSIQKWFVEPLSVLTDYEGKPLGSQHKAML